METRAHYVAVGLFVLAIVALAGVGVLWLAHAQLTTQFAYYDIFFQGSVGGLTEGADVFYKGIPVGHVHEIDLTKTTDQKIRVTVEIKSGVDIKSDARAQIDTNLLSGVATIAISGGKADSGATILPKTAEKEKHAEIQPKYSEMERGKQDLTDILRDLKEVLNEQNREKVNQILDNVRQLTADLASHGKDIDDTDAQINTAATSLAKFLTAVDHSFSDRNGLKDQLSAALADYDKLARGLGDTNHQLQGALQDARPGVRQFAQQTLPQVGDLVADARQLVQGLTRLADTIERDPTRFLFGDRREGYRPK